MPENPFASTFARSAIVARTVRGGSGSPRPAGVAAQQVELQLFERVGRDLHFRERAEAGVDAVGRLDAARAAIDDGA
jgi:hypothetical protein